MRTLPTAAGLVLTVFLFVAATASAQDVPDSRATPGNDAPAGPHVFYWGPASQTAPHGRPENHWRYRFRNGRWWYWTVDDNWSYFNGDAWVPYSANSEHYLSRAPLLGPIAGPTVAAGVIVRGQGAGLTLIPGDHPAAPHLKRGTVLPKYLLPAPAPDADE